MRARNGRPAARPAAAGVLILVAAVALPGWAQTPSVDDLLRLAVAPKPSDLYTMHAHFNVLLALRYGGGGVLTATAQGALTESHRPGEPLHRTLTIQQMRLPVVLRPFSGLIQRTIKERIETQPDDQPDFHAHDYFLLDDVKGGGYTLGGVRRDIVTQAIVAYTSSGAARTGDTDARRQVAKWLFTSPLMKSWLVRSGPPYAVEGLIDTQGLLRAFTLFYNWGNLHTQIDYTVINGAPVWNRLQSDVATSLPKLGAVTGELTIALSNQCLDCSTSGGRGPDAAGLSYADR